MNVKYSRSASVFLRRILKAAVQKSLLHFMIFCKQWKCLLFSLVKYVRYNCLKMEHFRDQYSINIPHRQVFPVFQQPSVKLFIYLYSKYTYIIINQDEMLLHMSANYSSCSFDYIHWEYFLLLNLSSCSLFVIPCKKWQLIYNNNKSYARMSADISRSIQTTRCINVFCKSMIIRCLKMQIFFFSRRYFFQPQRNGLTLRGNLLTIKKKKIFSCLKNFFNISKNIESINKQINYQM